MSETDHMTGAELQTLREACGLTREELGTLAGVAARTVKHWESGRAGVPADVAALVRRLDDTIRRAADEGAQAARVDPMHPDATMAPQEAILLRYRDADDLARYRPDMAGLPASVHGAIVGRLRNWLTHKGRSVRVVWMDPAAYEAWRAETSMPDAPDTRAAWAADQVHAQAIPHRADQPPA